MLDGFWPDFWKVLCEELENFWILLFDHLALKFSHSFKTSAYFYLIVQLCAYKNIVIEQMYIFWYFSFKFQVFAT